MNPKYTTASLAFGILIVFAPDTVPAQNPKPQVRQKASARSTAPAPQSADSIPSDLPIGVLQGMEDAKRYQELVRRAAREGQPAPPLPYAVSQPRPAAVPPAGAAYAPPSGASTTPSQPEVSNTVTNPYQPVFIPVMVPVPAGTSQSQYLQSPMQPIGPNLTFGQTKAQPTTPQPREQHLREQHLQEYFDALHEIHQDLSGGGRSSAPVGPVNTATPSQPISMPGPGPASLPFGRKP
ncbi:hypothetical protein J8C02_02150 [Chloracidobacterium sp. MS 40/45]|uniref:hypothetical protein n=1 Tax=Chloracidobacterium aggregatum TaxID=2851959 RepID=UPI001B8B688B|nr:hypothetical protein [Chloracidobacterium aggregatum]QUW00332.1 hypothetical protein J8C02_02150 [Chloracidobacterium sp. MS 40/45]